MGAGIVTALVGSFACALVAALCAGIALAERYPSGQCDIADCDTCRRRDDRMWLAIEFGALFGFLAIVLGLFAGFAR